PDVQFSVASQAVSEAAGTANIIVQMSSVSGQNVIVPWTVSGTATGGGTDYSITASPITIAAGQTTGTISVTINNDTLDENNETVILTMSAVTNGSASGNTVHTLTINDNDVHPTVQFTQASQAVSEAAGTATVLVSLSAPSGLNVVVPWTTTGT